MTPDAPPPHRPPAVDPAFRIAEYEALREEANRTVDRMNANEQVLGLSVFGLIAFQLGLAGGASGPTPAVVDGTIATLALLIALASRSRLDALRAHLRALDDHLRAREHALADDDGWVTARYEGAGRRPGDPFHRILFANALVLVSCANIGFQLGAAATGVAPRP